MNTQGDKNSVAHIRPPIRLSGHTVAKITLILVFFAVWSGAILGRFVFFVAALVVWVWVVLANGTFVLRNSYWFNLLKCNRRDRLATLLIKSLASLIVVFALFWFIFSLTLPIYSRHEWRAFSWPSLHERQNGGFSALSDERVMFETEIDCMNFIAQIKEESPTRVVACAADCDVHAYKYVCEIVR